MFLDDKLNFGEHLKYIANKNNKSIGPLRKLKKLLPRRSLLLFANLLLDFTSTMET